MTTRPVTETFPLHPRRGLQQLRHPAPSDLPPRPAHPASAGSCCPEASDNAPAREISSAGSIGGSSHKRRLVSHATPRGPKSSKLGLASPRPSPLRAGGMGSPQSFHHIAANDGFAARFSLPDGRRSPPGAAVGTSGGRAQSRAHQGGIVLESEAAAVVLTLSSWTFRRLWPVITSEQPPPSPRRRRGRCATGGRASGRAGRLRLAPRAPPRKVCPGKRV